MAKFLIIYGTKQGQSGKIAQAIGVELRKGEHTTDIFNSDTVPSTLKISNYDAFVVGGGVHIAGYPRSLQNWVLANSKELKTKPSAFYSVCLGILQNDQKVHEDEERIMQKFFKKTGWTPTTSVIFAGALMYSQYNWFLKRVMRSISRRAGVDTNLNQDYEYTDWNQVKDFAKKFAHV